MRLAVLLALSAAACATGGAAGDDASQRIDAPGVTIDGRSIDAVPPRIDAAPAPDGSVHPPDANVPPPDASSVVPDANVVPQAKTLSQSTAMTITSGNTAVCSSNDVNNVPLYTDENHFYRAFSLTGSGITGTFTAQKVNLGVEESQTTAGTQTISITLYTVAGTFPSGTLTQLATQNFTLGNIANVIVPETFTTPVVVPAGSTLVVEIASAGFSANNNFFYPGSNTAGESGPSYVKAPACNINSPTLYSSLGLPSAVDLVFTVDGTTP